MVLYVVRHGETDFNVQPIRYCGSTDVSLNQKGIEQARQAIDKLTDIDFEIIVSSPLIRAKQTAKIINGGFNRPLFFMDEFRERNMGVYEGLTRQQAKEKYPILREVLSAWQLDVAPEKGETIRQVDERVARGLQALEQEYNSKNILLVTHGFVYRIINRIYKNLSYDEMHNYSLGNCDIAKYTSDESS